MPSPAGTEAPLRLLCGSDLRLRRLRWLLAVLGAGAILFTPLPVPLRQLLALCPLLLASWIQYRRLPGRELELKKDGQCTIDGRAGTLLPNAWLSRHYSVVRARLDQKTVHLLISATRQADGEYRKLLTWMRLQPWDPD